MERSVGKSTMYGRMKAVFLSTVFTAGLFLLLPYVHLVVPAPPPMVDLIEIPRAILPEPPPLPILDVVEPLPVSQPVVQPALPPQLSQVVPLEPVLDFDFGLGEIGGDFSLAFSVEADAEAMSVGGVFALSDVDSVPQALVQMRPFYPAHARRRRTEGEVVVLFVVTPQGNTSGIQVVSSSPDDVFVAAAVRAVERWRFAPGMKAGEAVAVRVRQVIRFKMED